MKRLLVLALIAVGISVIAAQTASPAADTLGPPCANITDGGWRYTTDGMLEFTVFLETPECSFVTYSVSVSNTGGTLLAASSAGDSECDPGTEGDCLRFVFNLGSEAPSTVCISATTDIHDHLADRAPNFFDPSCQTTFEAMSVAIGTSGASGTFG